MTEDRRTKAKTMEPCNHVNKIVFVSLFSRSDMNLEARAYIFVKLDIHTHSRAQTNCVMCARCDHAASCQAIAGSMTLSCRM